MSAPKHALMDWDAKKFDVLVPKMNEQHHRLVDLMNKLYARQAANATQTELGKLIVELRDYTVRHFQDEEAFLESINYPQLSMHKNVHAKLLEDFAKHHAQFTATGKLSAAFFEFLRLWLTAHIMHIDRKYGDYSHTSSAA